MRRFKKSTISGKKPYEIVHSHDVSNPKKTDSNIITFAVIDPGSVNCGLYIADYDVSNDILNPRLVQRLQFKVKGKSEDINIQYRNSVIILENYDNYFLECHYIVIETQIGFAFNNVKMGAHLRSYFMTKFRNKGNCAFIIEINSSDKIRMLGCDLKEKKDYKKWSVTKALELLKDKYERNETCIKELESKGKKDDKADVICIGEVFKRYLKNSMGEEALFRIPLPN